MRLLLFFFFFLMLNRFVLSDVGVSGNMGKKKKKKKK